MPMWTVQDAGGEHERIEAGLLVTESGALLALSEEGVMMRAWAPGQWRTVRFVSTAGGHPTGRTSGTGNLLVGVPQV
jgi:hypothetical protein